MWEDIDLQGILQELINRILDHYESRWDWCVDSNEALRNKSHQMDRKLATAVPLHKNRNVEICVCIQGHTYLQIKERWVILKPGQFFVVPTGVMHAECVPKDEDCKALWMNMWQDQRIRAVITGRDDNGAYGMIYCRAIRVDPLMKSILLETLDRELTGDRFGAAMLVKARMVETMINLVRQIETEDQGQSVRQWQESVVAEVMDYLHYHRAERVELPEIAEHLSISVKHLNRIFKTATGTTVINYYKARRLEEAKHYLATTDAKIKDVAERLGYYDQYHFGRVFKKATGISPTQFRKARREE